MIIVRWNDVVYLIGRTIVYDEIGNPIDTEPSERMVYANEFSVSNSLQVGAAAANVRLEKIFEILSIEYNNEKQAKLTLDGPLYNVFNVDKRGDRTRLTLEKVN